MERALRNRVPDTRVAVFALGKAACAMASGALRVLGPEVGGGLIVTRNGYDTGFDTGPLPVFTAAHPVPDSASLEAGRRLVRTLEELPADHALLFLISGGTSSLVELLPSATTAGDLARATRWLLASGLDIRAANRVRSAMSELKGGRLASRIGGRSTTVCLISDVPGDDPAVIGSGPLAPAVPGPLPDGLPAWLRALTRHASPAPRPGDAVFDPVETLVVATNRDALEAGAAAAAELHAPVTLHEEFLAGEVDGAARRVADVLDAAPAGVHLWGGELTPKLPSRPGRGGRCQQLALSLARRLAGRSDLAVLCAGTDGADGPGEDAGALVDGDTLERGRAAGLDAVRSLAAANAGVFLEATGDLLYTGPTGSNVMDVVIAVSGFTARDTGVSLSAEREGAP